MNKPIRTYEDLLQEEIRLKGQLESYKTLVSGDFADLKTALNPFKRIAHTVRQFFTRDNNGPLYNVGMNIGVDVLFRRIILARAGFIVRILVPFLIKNFSSHFINEEEKNKVMHHIKNFISKINFLKKEPKETVTP